MYKATCMSSLYDGQIDTAVSSTTASQRRYVADADCLF